MKTVILTLLLAVTPISFASEANYFRVWQGFTKKGMDAKTFQKRLPAFMDSTNQTYRGGALNQYLVVVTPENLPASIPSEFALVALTSKEEYDRIRATPEGKAYADSHWEIFERDISKSAPWVNYFSENPDSLQHNTAYDLMGKPVDWTQGHVTFFLGSRKSGLGISEFLKGLSAHVKLVAQSFKGMGLKGYIVISNEEYEGAYMLWDSPAAMEAAFATPQGAAVVADAGKLLDPLFFQAAKIHEPGSPIQAGVFYSTVKASSKSACESLL